MDAEAPTPVPEDVSIDPAAMPTELPDESQSDEPLRDKSREPDVRDQMMADAYAAMNSTYPPTTPEDAVLWLETQGPDGRRLIAIAQRLVSGELKEGKDVIDTEDYIHLVVMSCFKGFGIEIADVRESFDAKEWTLADPTNPRRRSVDVEGPNGKRVTAVRLRDDISAIFRLLLPVRGQTALGAMAKARRTVVPPLGPYLDTAAATAIQDFTTINPDDGCWVRPGFYAYLTELASERGLPPTDLTSKEVRQGARDFCATHAHIKETWLLDHLRRGANPLLLAEHQSGRSQTVLNPGYQLELDIAGQRS